MTTNPTSLTALDYALKFYKMYSKDYKVKAGELEKLFKSYAAQQNAELVAENKKLDDLLATRDAAITAWMKVVKEWEVENERLKVAEQSYCRRISSLEKDIKSLQRSAVIRDTKLAKTKAHADLMQTENERLKQQLAWQPIPENPENYQIILGWDGKEIEKYMYRTEFYRKNPKPYWSCFGRTKKWSLAHQPLKHFVLPQPPKEAT